MRMRLHGGSLYRLASSVLPCDERERREELYHGFVLVSHAEASDAWKKAPRDFSFPTRLPPPPPPAAGSSLVYTLDKELVNGGHVEPHAARNE